MLTHQCWLQHYSQQLYYGINLGVHNRELDEENMLDMHNGFILGF